MDSATIMFYEELSAQSLQRLLDPLVCVGVREL